MFFEKMPGKKFDSLGFVSNREQPVSVGFRVLTLLLAVTAFGCSSPLVLPDGSAPVLSGESILGRPVTAQDLPDHQFLRVNQQMRDFVASYVNTHKSAKKKLRALALRLHRRMDYDPRVTHTAAGTFDLQKGNCLSFAAMFVALAREAGLQASFNEVVTKPSWGQTDKNSYISYRHINIYIEDRHAQGTVDLGVVDYDESQPLSRISDTSAEAQYYNNLSIDALLEGDIQSSFLYIRKALSLDPEQDYIWSNLGIIYRKYGLTNIAEQAFLTALSLDPEQRAAASNLEQLYIAEGDLQRAEPYATIARKYRNKNPYYRYDRALELASSSPEEALKHIRAAIRYQADEQLFYALAAKIYTALGKKAMARKQLEYAENIESRRLVDKS